MPIFHCQLNQLTIIYTQVPSFVFTAHCARVMLQSHMHLPTHTYPYKHIRRELWMRVITMLLVAGTQVTELYQQMLLK